MARVADFCNVINGDTQYKGTEGDWQEASGQTILEHGYQSRSRTGSYQYGIALGLSLGVSYDRCKMTLNNAEQVHLERISGTVYYWDDTGQHTLTIEDDYDNVTIIETQTSTSEARVTEIDGKAAYTGESD